jgi:hypothetical protein
MDMFGVKRANLGPSTQDFKHIHPSLIFSSEVELWTPNIRLMSNSVKHTWDNLRQFCAVRVL